MAGQIADYKDIILSKSLEENIRLFKDIFKKDAVLRLRRVSVRNACSYDCALFYMDGMINAEISNKSVIRPLVTSTAERKEDSLVGFIAKLVLFAGEKS